jgi:hypothetical protein
MLESSRTKFCTQLLYSIFNLHMQIIQVIICWLLTMVSWVNSQVTVWKICDNLKSTRAGCSSSFFCFPLLNIIPLLLHIQLSPAPPLWFAATLMRQHIMSWFLSKVFYSDAPAYKKMSINQKCSYSCDILNSFHSFLTLAQSFQILAIYVSLCKEWQFTALYSTVITKSFKFKRVYKCWKLSS